MLGFNAPATLFRDERLIARVGQGDRAAFKTLYDRHAGRVFAAARRLLADAEAEEVVQETFLDVWNRASTFKEALGSVANWILSLGRNRTIDRLRTSTSRLRTLDGLEREPGAAAPLTPDRHLERSQDAHRVAKALSVLPPDQRRVVELAYFDGLSQSEIAERTGDPVGTIKGRARSALAKLSRALGEEAR